MPPLYGFDEEPDVPLELLELLSEELPDELSALLLSGSLLELPELFVSTDDDPLALESSDELDELEELVLVEFELLGVSSSLPELLQPPSAAVIINAAIINESFFFMMSPLP